MSVLKETRFIMDKYHISANKNLGQNFLIDDETVLGIVNVANISKDDLVIEIGPGLGTLTKELLERAGQVTCIELDKRMIEILQDRFSMYNNFELINSDVLKVDLKEIIKKSNLANTKIVANLPYYITTPIIMKLLEERILKDGIALNENVLKVDSFLNHQVDVNLMDKIGDEFYSLFKNKNIDKVITIEASGIAPAYATAIKLNVPLVILKKSQSNILNNNLYTTVVHSFTKNIDYNITCSQKFLLPNENILFIDDFLANGEAVLGAYRLCKMANCNLIGVGIVIEKSFQPGRKKLEHLNLNVHSLARIEKLSKGKIVFK